MPSPELNGVCESYPWWTDRRTPSSNDFHTFMRDSESMDNDNWLRISVDTLLHTLLNIKFDRPDWVQRRWVSPLPLLASLGIVSFLPGSFDIPLTASFSSSLLVSSPPPLSQVLAHIVNTPFSL